MGPVLPAVAALSTVPGCVRLGSVVKDFAFLPL